MYCLRVHCIFLLCASLPTGKAKEGHFAGGSLSFSFVSDTKVLIRCLLGWDLGYGSCGLGCERKRIGTSTKISRAQIINTNGQDYFGNWTVEVKGSPIDTDITLFVNGGIEGQVSDVNDHLKLEQDYDQFLVDLDPSVSEEDVILKGNYWKRLNALQSRRGDVNHTKYHLQIKIRAGRRNDTGNPNNSPQVLFKPVYRIKLNAVTEIKLATFDADGDVVHCSEAKYIEAGDLNQMKTVKVERNCSIFINASEMDGFEDNDTVVVLLKAMDYNYKPVIINGEHGRIRRPFESAMSNVPVQFLVRSTQLILNPEFVSPTPKDHQMFEVYAGSRFVIPLFAKPHGNSSQSVASISVSSIPRMNISLSTLTSDPKRISERVEGLRLTWDTTANDVGSYLIQAYPVDTSGIDGNGRSFPVLIRDVNITVLNTTVAGDLSSPRGHFTCKTNSICTVPLMFSPGQIIQDVTMENSTLPGVVIGPLRQDHSLTFTTDFTFLGSETGNQSICLKVKTSYRDTLVCTEVTIIPQDPCMTPLCGKFGECFASWDKYRCVCRPGYTGTHCETAINYCDPNPCLPGTCYSVMVLEAHYICKCLNGTTGTSCIADIHECSSNPCQHNGTCTDMVNSYSCSCLPGYTGTFCEKDMDQCKSAPCEHGGTCVDDTNSYTCVCQPGYTGDICQTDIDECATVECGHGGICTDLINSYSCTYIAGHTGELCQIAPPCGSGPCRNQGSCEGVSEYQYTCHCLVGYKGTNCEINYS